MKAYIRGSRDMIEVIVKQRTIDESGLVRIEDDCGVIYETHLVNVIFVGVEE